MEFQKTSRIWILSLCLVVFASAAYSGTITVGPGGSGAGYDYGTIQEGISAAVNGDTVIIVPAAYTGANNKNLDFGGRAITVRSTDPNDPSVVAATIINCGYNGRGFYFHSGEDNNSVICGLTITHGKVDRLGGGILCSGSSPLIKNCRIVYNEAYSDDDDEPWGGGIACLNDSHPKITSCIIRLNNTDTAYGIEFGDSSDAYGGGVYCDSQSSVDIYDSEIVNNYSEGGTIESWPLECFGYGAYGGGLYLAGSTTSNIRNCIIADNKTYPGACYDSINEEEVYGLSYGGGIYCGSGTTISNCTIYNNNSSSPEGVGGGIYGSPTVTNCILWANEAHMHSQIHGSATVTYSDVQGGYTGTGNINSEPCFVSGPGGAFYLSQIAAGQAVDSNCVDAGSDTAANLGMDLYTTRTDRRGDSGVVDMGYHYQFNPADIDGDGDVDFEDFAILANQWQQAPGIPSADIAPMPDGDGIVNEKDLELFVESWH